MEDDKSADPNGSRISVSTDEAIQPAPTSKDLKYQRRYGEILDAAAEVFATKGYHGASTKDIADKLNIRQGSLYYYFSSKEIALEEVCKIGVAGFVSRLEDILESPATVADKIRRAILTHLEPLNHRRFYTQVFMHERQNLTGAGYNMVAGLARDYEDLFDRLLKEGIEAGILRAGMNRRMAVLGILGMCNSISIWYRPDGDLSLEEIATNISEVVLDGLRGR